MTSLGKMLEAPGAMLEEPVGSKQDGHDERDGHDQRAEHRTG